MHPTDELAPLIAFIANFTSAATSPVLACLVLALIMASRRSWQRMAGLPVLAAFDTAFAEITETAQPLPLTALVLASLLAVALQGAVAVMLVDTVRLYRSRFKDRAPAMENDTDSTSP